MEQLLNKRNQPTVFGVNLVYLSVLILMLVAQAVSARWVTHITLDTNYYYKLAGLELLLIGGPPVLYLLLFKVNVAKVCRFNRLKPVEVLLVLGIAIFGYGVTIIINLIWFWIASHWGTPMGQELPSIESGKQFIMAVLAIGVVPAVVEEFLFRGFILRGYEKYGSKIAIIMAGVLFGMLHLQLMTIPSIILLGIVISYVVYRTDSIFAGMIYHFVHNTITVGFLYIQNSLIKNAGAIEVLPQDITQLPHNILLAAMIIWGIIGFVSLVLFVICLVSLRMYTTNKGQVRSPSPLELKRSNIYEMLPAIIAMVVVIINVIFEILHMAGVLLV